MGLYLIGKDILFDSDTLTMRSLYEPSKQIVLGNVASRCLSVLLDAEGKIIKKRDLIYEIWGKLGIEVTDNSLAQAIRQIRCAINEFAPNEQIIVTIPRIGYKVIPACETDHQALMQEQNKARSIMPNQPQNLPIRACNLLLAGAASIIGFGLGSLFMLPVISLQ